MSFFKSKAERLIEVLSKAMKGSGTPMEKLQRYRDAQEEVKAWGAAHPEGFIALLTEENAGNVGSWIAGSGEIGIALLNEIIWGDDVEEGCNALRALWEFEEAAAS